MPAEQQAQAVETVVYHDALLPRDRLAAILVLVFAQKVEDMVTLTWDKIAITPDRVTIDLANFPIDLEPPLDQAVRDLAAAPLHSQTAAHPNTKYVFRGSKPGQHINAHHLQQRLKPIFSALAARQGTLRELTRTTPVAIVAETLGYRPQTVEAHARAAAADYGQYMGARSVWNVVDEPVFVEPEPEFEPPRPTALP